MLYLTYTDRLGGRMGLTFNSQAKAMSFFIAQLSSTREIALYRDTTGFHSTTQLSYLILWHGEDCYWSRSLKSASCQKMRKKIEDKKYK